MNIAWQVASPVTSPFVRIGTDPYDLGERIPAEIKNLSTPWADITDFLDSVPPAAAAAQAPEEQYYVHAAAGQPHPGTTYYYVVGHQGFDFSPSAASRRARSPASPPRPHGPVPFTFTAFGDQGTSYDAVATSNLILAQSPAFHLHAGDVSYAEDGGDGLITDAYDPRAWDSCFTADRADGAADPVDGLAGQPRDGAVVLARRLRRPTWTASTSPATGPACAPARTTSPTATSPSSASTPTTSPTRSRPTSATAAAPRPPGWVRPSARCASDPAVDFIVVFFHHCAYCTCTAHGCEGGVRQFWTPLFDQYEVDLVINGHNHIYERTDPITGRLADDAPPHRRRPSPRRRRGRPTWLAGGAGKSLYAFSAPDSYEGNVDNVASVEHLRKRGGRDHGQRDGDLVPGPLHRLLPVVVEVTPPTFGRPTTLLVRGLERKRRRDRPVYPVAGNS